MGCHFLPLGVLPDPGIKPASLASPALASRFLTTAPPGKPRIMLYCLRNATEVSIWCLGRWPEELLILRLYMCMWINMYIQYMICVYICIFIHIKKEKLFNPWKRWVKDGPLNRKNQHKLKLIQTERWFIKFWLTRHGKWTSPMNLTRLITCYDWNVVKHQPPQSQCNWTICDVKLEKKRPTWHLKKWRQRVGLCLWSNSAIFRHY